MTLTPERQALLTQKRDEYVASMESPGSGIDYARVDVERLIVLEAINDWSGRALVEGGEIKLTYGCTDPCCATAEECSALAKLMHKKSPVILYPVSGFSLSNNDELRFSFAGSGFRMLPHHGGSRADGIGIAESRHIRNVDGTMQLWVACATEDCMAYLFTQMDAHNLLLEDEESSAVRGIITSAIQDHFSPGQIWNAIWRSVKDAAALSTRQYYNNAKAAKTIPNKIDKVLTWAATSSGPFEAYDRIAATPMGAVLTLFLHRFGITDSTTGNEARAKLEADAALAPQEDIDEDFDEGRGLLAGTFYFRHKFTTLDRMILSCFKDIRLEANEPTWGVQHPERGRIDFSVQDYYSFDGNAFSEELLPMLGATAPTDADIARHAAIAAKAKADGKDFVDASGWSGAFEEALVRVGISADLASRIRRIVRYPADPVDIVGIACQLPLPCGLTAIRARSAHVYNGFVEESNWLAVGNLQLSVPELNFEPLGDDEAVVSAITEESYDLAATLVSTGLIRMVRHSDEAKRAHLLRLIARKMIEEADQIAPEQRPSGLPSQ